MKTLIYTLSNPLTQEVKYIGKTINNLNSRLRQHITRKRMNKTTCWIKSLFKEGLIPLIEELDSCEWEQSADLEIFYISIFKLWGFNLTNLTDGGEGTIGYKFSEESKAKIGKANKGNKVWEGRKHSEETKNKISIANKGKQRTNEFKEFRSNYQKNKNWKPSNEMYENMLKSHARKVIQLDKENNIIKEFLTIASAARELSLRPEKITLSCQSKTRKHGGFKWEYIS